MKKYTLALLASVILGLVACGSGENGNGTGCGDEGCTASDGPLKFKLKASGDSINSFSVKNASTGKPDYSTARSIVEDVAKFVAKDVGMQSEGDRISKIFAEVILGELVATEKMLLSSEIAKEMADARKIQKDELAKRDEGKPEKKIHPIEISEGKEQKDGSVTFVLTQKSVGHYKESEDGEWIEDESTKKTRLTATKIDDGTWRISKAEDWKQSDKDKPDEGEWKEQHILVKIKEMVAYQDKMKMVTKIDNSSAEATARAVVDSYFSMEGAAFFGAFVYTSVAMAPMFEELFTTEKIASENVLLEKELKEAEGTVKKSEPREIDSTSVDGDITTIVFKLKDPKGFSKDKLVLKLKKFDDGWKVIEGGTMVMPWNAEEGAKPEYKKAELFSRLKWK